jgi:hypothetical protein
MERIQITPAVVPDPNAVPRTDIVAGPNGGVKVDPALTPAPVVKAAEGERPSWLPEKFKTAEDFAKSYTELETKLGTPAKPAVVTPALPQVTAAAAAKAGVDLPALAKEFAEKGALSAETLASLSKAGFNQGAVDSYILGQQAVAAKLTTALEEVAGGKPELQATLEWAKANLNADEVAAYNAAIDSGNPQLAKLALQGVVASYTEANGKEPALLKGGESAPGSGGFVPYASNAQMTKDMRSPEYKTDPAFREMVKNRLSVTNYGAR